MRHIPFPGTLIVFLLAISWSGNLHAQCTLQCLGGTVDIPLDDNCSATVDPAVLIVNDPDCSPLTMEIFDENGLPFAGNMLGVNQLYKVYSAQISFNGAPPQVCVTKIRAIDEIDPVIQVPCLNQQTSCNADTAVANFPMPAFSDNCGPLVVTHTDLVINAAGCS